MRAKLMILLTITLLAITPVAFAGGGHGGGFGGGGHGFYGGGRGYYGGAHGSYGGRRYSGGSHGYWNGRHGYWGGRHEYYGHYHRHYRNRCYYSYYGNWWPYYYSYYDYGYPYYAASYDDTDDGYYYRRLRNGQYRYGHENSRGRSYDANLDDSYSK